VTRVERYAGHCRCCGGVTLAPVPVGMEESWPFSTNTVALAIYLRFTHAISYRRLNQLFLHLYALQISEGAGMRCCSGPSHVSTTRSRLFSPGCAARGSSAAMRSRFASTAAIIGTEFSRTTKS
jgi:hypothetical protein